ncbi:acetoin utilization protein AcuC [Longispora albida]|uniref:acetoin utilization protein AcuC n=1 Tax=Longispora albida TaxID=203523 RepID=UPI00035F2B6E|nr:acetoin utilization protein AcuC [Longispora albida]
MTLLVWSEDLRSYDLGEHPLDPVRLELTWALAGQLGVLDRPGVVIRPAVAASEQDLLRVHSQDYLSAVRRAPDEIYFSGYGLNTPDNPLFDGMYEASALVSGATMMAAEAVWSGEFRRAVSLAGGLHHAFRASAAGFCVFNDPAVAIARLLELGAERVAYIDIDVHHGDGVQSIFYDDPRVMTVSLHETGYALFPGTGFAAETGGPGAEGTSVNVALPPETGDAGWLRAFHAVVPGVLRAFKPQILITQCGADPHRLDPLADLRMTVDGQRAAQLALRDLAEELCEGRWVATGGGGYSLANAVPRAWTHLLATATGIPLDPATPIPPKWRKLAAQRRPHDELPLRMTDDGSEKYLPWQPGLTPDPLDRAILASRQAVYPLHGLDPLDARD